MKWGRPLVGTVLAFALASLVAGLGSRPALGQSFFEQEILTARDTTEDFSHLSEADRKGTRGILQETKPDLASYWNSTR